MEDIIKVTRVHNFKDESKIIFKDNMGKIVHLDRKDEGNEYLASRIAIGDELFVCITTYTDSYNYAMGTVNGVSIEEFVNSLPTMASIVLLNAYDANVDTGDDIRLLVNIVNNIDNVGSTEITLDNFIEIYDTYGATHNIYKALTSLQYLYNELYANDNNNGLSSELAVQMKSAYANVDVEDISADTGDTTTVDYNIVPDDIIKLENQIVELETAVKALLNIGMTEEADSVKSKISALLNKIDELKVTAKMIYDVVYLIITKEGKTLLGMLVNRPQGDVIIQVPTGSATDTHNDDIAISDVKKVYSIKPL